jgi:hypothetical protein
MSVRIFQPFGKVWTPRVPDSDYSSLGSVTPPAPIIILPLISENAVHGIFLESGAYYAGQVLSGAVESLGQGVFFKLGTYTP